MIADELVGPNDITSVREVPLDSGNILYIRRTDPYGFINFTLQRGRVPDWMSGNYTSWTEAQKAVQQYLVQRRLEANQVVLTSPKADPKKAQKE